MLVVVDGACGLRVEGDDEQGEIVLSRGQVWLVPASLTKITLEGHGAGARVLMTTAKE